VQIWLVRTDGESRGWCGRRSTGWWGELRVVSVSASGGLEWERRWGWKGVRWELHAGGRGKKRCWCWRWIGGSDGEVEDLVFV